MKIYLLAIDLDGTLLNSDKQISAATLVALDQARVELGVRIVLATARPPRSTLPFHRQLALDTPLINYNGALVYCPASGRILMHRPISLKISRGIIAAARAACPDILVSAEILDRWYTDRVDDAYMTETGKLVKPDVIAPLEQWLTQSVTKLLLLGDPRRLGELARLIAERFTHQVTIVQTDEYLLQIMDATVSKAQGLRVVAAELGVSREQVMAIGDNSNDVGMLQWAGQSVAMSNGTMEAMSAADWITDDNDSDGVANAVRKAILSGE